MFFKKKQDEQEIEYIEQPLHYWEEESYLVIPYKDEELTKELIVERINSLGNISIQGFAEPSDTKPGRVVFTYEKIDYEVGYYIDNFSLPSNSFYNANNEFNEKEILDISNCNKAITLFMSFTDNYRKEYQMELLLASKIVNKLRVVLDESAEKILHPKYVTMIANSKSLPLSEDLYTIQAIVDKDEVWLHTHGLLRFGIPELEILNSNRVVYNNHYNIISTLVTHLMDKGINEDNQYIIGFINENDLLVVSLLPWTEGLKYYNNKDMGGIKDRENEHNSKTSIIFTYANEEDIESNKISKLEMYDNKWGMEPIYFITSEETDRMSLLARERFEYVSEASKQVENSIIIKIGIDTDNGEKEHMWFELIDILDNNMLKLKLISEPFNVSGMHEGDICEYSVSDITDWIIYTKNSSIGPDKVYLLD